VSRALEELEADLSRRLAKVPKLSIPSREDVLQATAAAGPLPGREQLGQQLGVQAILTGNVDVVKKTLLIRMQLMDVESGAILWSNQYDALVDQVPVAQLAEDIAENVRSRLTARKPPAASGSK
jgi:TolB-like protein